MKYKVGKSSIQGKGLIVKEPFKEGELIGLAHINNQPTKVVGLHHNHSDEPTAGNIEVGNKRYLVALRNLKPGEEITTNYREQPELEQPEDFEKKKGGAVSMPTDKPEKSKKFSRSLDATNRLFTENNLFKRPKSRKNKVFDPKAKYYQKGGALLTKKVTCKDCGWTWDAADGGNDMTTCHKCGGQGLVHAQDGGAPIPKGYQAALSQFVNPVVNDTDENTGYNASTGEVNRDTRPGSIENNNWWLEHEKFHHLQNLAGGMNTAGAVGERPNNTVASDESIQGYYNRRDSDLNDHINSMIKVNPELQFIPKEKLLQSQFPVEGEQPSFLGAEDSIYQDPSTVEGEARVYEEYINNGGKSVFPQKKKGGEPEDRFKKRLLKRYPGMQGVYGKEGENLNIIKDPNYAAADYGFGNIEFIHPGSGHVQYSDDYDYQSPTPDKYTAVYNPKGANKHDVFLDTMHGMRDDPEYMKLLDKFSSETKKTRGESMDHWYEVDSKKDPYLVEDGREQWDKNFIDGVLRSHLAKKGMGRHSSDVKGYKMERQESTPEMYKATDDIYKYLKGKFKNGGAYYDDSRDAWVGADGTVGPNGPATYANGGESGCPDNMIWDEATQSCVSANETTTEEVGFDPIDMWAEDYEQKNPRGSYVYDKKQEYLKKTNRGLSKLAGITLDNFPKEVEDQINEKYNYNMNGYITDRMAKVKKFNPNKHDEWVDELGDRSKEVIANSKYGSKLQPSLWARSLAGGQELGNAVVKTLRGALTGETGKDVFNHKTPGLTQKEWNEIHNSSTGALETLSAADVPGAVVANYLKNSKKDNPNVFSGELMSNVDATDAMAMNPMGVIGGIEGLAALGTKGISLLGLTADALKPGAKYLSSINSIPTLNKPVSPISFESVPAQFKRGPDAYRIKMNNEWIGDFDLEKDFTNMANGNWVIGNVYLREAHQGKGLGKESFIQANNLLKSQGKGELHSSGYFYGPSAKHVWESLVKEGKAEKIGKDAWRFKSTDLPGSPNASTITEPFEIAKKRILNSSDNTNRIIRKPEPVAKPNYGQQEFAFPTDAPIPSARLSYEEQMIEGMERARLAKNEEGTALNPSVGVDKPRVIKSPDYYLDIMKMNKYNGKNKQYFIDLVESVKKQGNVASERQYDELQRILSGDYTRDKRGYAEVPTKLPGSPNAYDDVQKAGFLNPLAIADRVIPRLPYPSWYLGQQGSWNNLSPLNIIPGYGKKLSNTAGQYPVGFRKFGNTLDDVKSSKTLRPKGGFRKGADQMAREGNWAEPGKVNENYVGVFEATMDPNIEGSNIKLTKKPNRYGIVGTTKEGDVAIPLTDTGLSFNRRLPFSNKYVPINKQKLLDNKFQLATQLPHVQSLIEKYGIAAGQALVFGYLTNGKEGAIENLKTVNKYSIDPVINWSKKEWDNLKKMTTDKKEGGPIEMDLTEDEINSYKEGGWVVEYVD